MSPFWHQSIFYVLLFWGADQAAPKAYFAKQSMERVRRGTAKSPVFAIGKNGPNIILHITTLIILNIFNIF